MSPFDAAYQRGLVAFIRALENLDPEDVAGFKRALWLAVERFAIRRNDMEDRLGAGKGLISKWCRTTVKPTKSARELVTPWLIAKLKLQVTDEMTLPMSEDDMKLRAALAYHDPKYEPRKCDHCRSTYRGPSVYCSLHCAELAAKS